MTFLKSKSSISNNQTIIKMMSVLGLVALTNSVYSMEILTKTDKPIGISEPIAEIKEPSSSTNTKHKPKKRSHKRTATDTNPTVMTEVISDITADPIKIVINTDPLIPMPATPVVIPTSTLQTILAELGVIINAGQTGCVSCLKALPGITQLIAQDIVILVNETVQTGEVIQQGVNEINDLVKSVEHYNRLQTKAQKKIYAPTLNIKLEAIKTPLIEHNLAAFGAMNAKSTKKTAVVTMDTTTASPTSDLQTLLPELQTITTAGQTGCISCLKSLPGISQLLAQDVVILINEAVQTGQAIDQGVAEINDLINTTKHYNALQTKAQRKLYTSTLTTKLEAVKKPLIDHNRAAYAKNTMKTTKDNVI